MSLAALRSGRTDRVADESGVTLASFLHLCGLMLGASGRFGEKGSGSFPRAVCRGPNISADWNAPSAR
jgi:hypothetical protein